jgi:hypothetical protein
MRKGRRYTKEAYQNSTKRKLEMLQQAFGFTCCMVEGCGYNRVYDVHRFISGKHGGRYVIGNMFAICPNHHAEVTRGLIQLEKISDCLLRIVSSW